MLYNDQVHPYGFAAEFALHPAVAAPAPVTEHFLISEILHGLIEFGTEIGFELKLPTNAHDSKQMPQLIPESRQCFGILRALWKESSTFCSSDLGYSQHSD
jgi:hypothetical protein